MVAMNIQDAIQGKQEEEDEECRAAYDFFKFLLRKRQFIISSPLIALHRHAWCVCARRHTNAYDATGMAVGGKQPEYAGKNTVEFPLFFTSQFSNSNLDKKKVGEKSLPTRGLDTTHCSHKLQTHWFEGIAHRNANGAGRKQASLFTSPHKPLCEQTS